MGVIRQTGGLGLAGMRLYRKRSGRMDERAPYASRAGRSLIRRRKLDIASGLSWAGRDGVQACSLPKRWRN
jgi:hypothetical protein